LVIVETGAYMPTKKAQAIPTSWRAAVFPRVVAQAGRRRKPDRSEFETIPGVAGKAEAFLGNNPSVVVQALGHPPFLNEKPGPDAFPVHVRGEPDADQRLVPADASQLIPGDGADL
jgi:hypothetical protein